MLIKVRFVAALAILGIGAARLSAVELFSDNFNVDSSGAWTTNAAPTANAGTQQATFVYDYSAMGIPPAPGSADTLGLRLRSNIPIVAGNEVTTRPAGVISGLSVSPTGKSFGTNYQMTVYAWANYCGAPNASGLADNGLSEGGTFTVMTAVGTTGTVPLVVGNTALVTNASMDGIGFATTGDGGIASDYRVYPKSGTIVPATAAGVYAANSATALSSSDPFYTNLFPPTTAPAIQQDISTAEYGLDAFNTQAGSTPAGSIGFAWRKIEIIKNNNVVTWEIDDNLIATYDASALTLGGANIALGMSDVNTSTTRHPSLVFTLFDNLVVTDIPSPFPPGDFNEDTFVNDADFAQWSGDFGVDGGSDADGDNDSDGRDFLIWQQNYGAGPLAASIPEPATPLMALAGVIALIARRRRAAGLKG